MKAIAELMLGEISKDDFLNQNAIQDITDAIEKGLNEARCSQNAETVDEFIYLIFVFDIFSKKILNILNELLISDWHYKHEDIVMLLQKIASNESMEYLYRAISLRPRYMSHDDNYSFEVKCVRAMYYIDQKNAYPYLEKIAKYSSARISECALKELKKIKDSFDMKREIRAVFNENTVRIYQAFNDQIAREAIQKGKFGESFQMDRMTWIKPSFLWMMYRCGWGTKENQEHILAIDIKRCAFDYLINNAVSSIYLEDKYGSYSYWQWKLRSSDVICQWDPERDIYGNPLSYRSIQLGLRREALKKYVQEWIVSIEDITDYVTRLKNMKEMNQDIDLLLPKASVYTV